MWEGQRQYNVMVGALKKEEVQRHISFNANIHLKPENRAQEHARVIDAYPELSLLLDVDYFQNEPKLKVSDAPLFIEAAKQRSQRTAEALASYLLGD